MFRDLNSTFNNTEEWTKDIFTPFPGSYWHSCPDTTY